MRSLKLRKEIQSFGLEMPENPIIQLLDEAKRFIKQNNTLHLIHCLNLQLNFPSLYPSQTKFTWLAQIK